MHEEGTLPRPVFTEPLVIMQIPGWIGCLLKVISPHGSCLSGALGLGELNIDHLRWQLQFQYVPTHFVSVCNRGNVSFWIDTFGSEKQQQFQSNVFLHQTCRFLQAGQIRPTTQEQSPNYDTPGVSVTLMVREVEISILQFD